MAPSPWAPSPPARLLTRLADRALALASVQADASPSGLARTLYEYNRLPATRGWMACWQDSAAVLDAVTRIAPLHEDYDATVLGAPGWLQWRPRRPPPPSDSSRRLKFYISPHPEQLHDALAAALPILGRHGAPPFKLACDAYGLLRPDKWVVYLNGTTDPAALARDLSEALAGCRPQGAPFTAGVNPEGTVSWGVDPPAGEGPARSWRLWITTELGRALAEARGRTGFTGKPEDYVRRHLEAAGVDTDRWAPGPDLERAFLEGGS